ncbi:MAG: rod shape-determining protein MreC [Firmicutes bacterium]|nr:rod shape-determining protein MreC [Bacillota bacterium]
MLAPKKKKKQQYKKIGSLLLVLAVLLVLAAFTAHRQGVTFPEEILQVIVAPVQGAFQRLTSSVKEIYTTLKDYRLLMQENKELRRELAEAVTLEARLNELRKENARLRRMLELKEASTYDLIAAEVIARDPAKWFDTVTINKGTRHGVQEKMAVITTDGLIGNILAVTPTTAQVLLLTDSRRGVAVAAMVQRSREPGEVGVVENDPQEPGSLRIKDLPREANILPGDTIISSGLGGVFPKGFVIGYVLETGVDELGLTQYATLQPAANFNRLEEVFVVVPQEDAIDLPVEEEETEHPEDGAEPEGDAF